MNITAVNPFTYKIEYKKSNDSKMVNNITNVGLKKQNLPIFFYKPSFGYCEPHMRLMSTLNNQFANAVNSIISKRDEVLDFAKARQQKIDENNSIYKLSAQMLAQYANYQYSMAEVIPSYAMESAPEVAAALTRTTVFTNPVDIMLVLKNIPELQTAEGFDKNTGKPYTDEQMRKSKANTQLYTSVLLLEMLDKNLEKSELDKKAKSMIVTLRQSVLDSISSIYGSDAYERIQVLKKMGKNASIEDKRKSLDLVREFDEKAQALNFGSVFNEKLNELINHINTVENRINEVDKNTQEVKIPTVKLMYHTHPEGMEHSHSHDHCHHDHEHDGLTHEQMHQLGIEHSHKNINIENK